MKRTAAILIFVGMVSLLGASDVRGGGGALVGAGKTTGYALTATIETDVTNGPCSFFQIGVDPQTGTPIFTSICKGLTAIRVQKAGANTAAIFLSSYVHGFVNECTDVTNNLDLNTTTFNRFTGLINGFVDTPTVLSSLLQQFGDPNKAAITNQAYVVCNDVDYGGVKRKVLSFTAVIQFQP